MFEYIDFYLKNVATSFFFFFPVKKRNLNFVYLAKKFVKPRFLL